MPKHVIGGEDFENIADKPRGSGKWVCPRCGEAHDSTFEVCWNCGTGRSGELSSARFRESVDAARLLADSEQDVPFPGAIGFTHDGEPIYPVIGYKADGTAVTADQAAEYRRPGQGMNSSAIVAFILAFVAAPLAIPVGHVALWQISRFDEQGRGLAIAALVIGYLSLLPIIMWMIIAL